MALPTLLQQVQSIFNEPKAYKHESVQSLWSGYGEISRYALPNKQGFCIVKEINLAQGAAHPRGWDSAFSHQRKLSSYYNEQVFYANIAGLCNDQCKVPQLIAHGSEAKQLWLIMEDLDAAGFALRHVQANADIALTGVHWLAHFHACFLKPAHTEILTKAWPIGTYWHLDTRPDEWQNMPNGDVKQQAQAIDEKLNNARFQTLLHGDAKLANFCFSPTPLGKEQNRPAIAAVDFQYCGKGVGVKDLIYFLGSCFSSQDLYLHAEDLINAYFQTLRHAISEHDETEKGNTLEQEWRSLLPFAWADFERFLMGWSPDHHKRHDYSQQQTQQALKALKT